MSDDRALYDAAMKLHEYVIKGDTLIYLLTTDDLAELNAVQVEQLKEEIETESLDCLACVSHGFPVFAVHSDLVNIPVEPVELSYPDETAGAYPPGDLRGTSYHHAAVNFLRFHCIGTNFWQADSKGLLREFPPKFDIDTLLYGLELERMRVFKSIVMESKPGERAGIIRGVKESPKPKSALTIRNNFKLIEFNGTQYPKLSPLRSKCFKVMYERQAAGLPPLRDEDIIHEADSESSSTRLRDVFKGHPIYGVVIIDVPGMEGYRQLVDF